jgi:hypothetical protein
MGCILTTEEELAILKLYKEGMQFKAIVSEMQLSPKSIAKVIERGRPRTREEREYSSGCHIPTPEEIEQRKSIVLVRRLEEMMQRKPRPRKSKTENLIERCFSMKNVEQPS